MLDEVLEAQLLCMLMPLKCPTALFCLFFLRFCVDLFLVFVQFHCKFEQLTRSCQYIKFL